VRRIATLMVITGLVLTACARGDSATETAGDTMAPEATIAPRPADEDAGEGEGASLATPEVRKVIHRASISIEAEDTRAVYRRVRTMVQQADGFVQSATISDPESGEDQPRIDLVIRIPAAGLDTALDEIGALGTRVVSQSQQGQDVTEEYVDVRARIDNLSLLEDELRALLADVRENPEADPQKLLQVFNEISRVRGEIEQLEGRKQMLDNLTELATVEVKVTPTPEVTPVVADGWTPLAVVRQSIQDLVGALQGLADLTIRFGLFLLPLLLLAALPLYGMWRVGRRLSRDIPSPCGGNVARERVSRRGRC
jgi:hypothetical protein